MRLSKSAMHSVILNQSIVELKNLFMTKESQKDVVKVNVVTVTKRPWTSVKEYVLIRDKSEKVYDLLGCDGKVGKFNIAF